MTKMIKTTLVAMAILAGASAGYAADGKGGGVGSGAGGFGQDGGRSDEQQMMKQEEMIDRNPTGSIVTCDSGAYDANGNCIMDPNMQ